jgi:hypothetical protein
VSCSATGTIEARELVDGTRAFHLRFLTEGRRELVVLHERPGCGCGCGGGWSESSARAELGNIQARVGAGVWERPSAPADRRAGSGMDPPLFEEYAWWWLGAKMEGTIGIKPIGASTVRDYRWRIERHLLPFFGHHRLDEIDEDRCQQFKAKKLRDATEQRKAINAGAVLRDERKPPDRAAGASVAAQADGHAQRDRARRRGGQAHPAQSGHGAEAARPSPSPQTAFS